MQNEKGESYLAKLSKYNLLDYQDGHLLSVGEKGHNGFYHKLVLEDHKSKSSN